MGEIEKSSKQGFIIAAQGTVEQKRAHDLSMIRDEMRQENIRSMIRYRDERLRTEKERLERQRDQMAKEIAEKRSQPSLNMKPSHMAGLSIDAQRQLVRRAVENKHGPEHAQQISRLKEALNQNIDREIQNARSLEKDRSNVRIADPAVREKSRVQAKIDKMRENGRDITEKRELSRKYNRDRS